MELSWVFQSILEPFLDTPFFSHVLLPFTYLGFLQHGFTRPRVCRYLTVFFFTATLLRMVLFGLQYKSYHFDFDVIQPMKMSFCLENKRLCTLLELWIPSTLVWKWVWQWHHIAVACKASFELDYELPLEPLWSILHHRIQNAASYDVKCIKPAAFLYFESYIRCILKTWLLTCKTLWSYINNWLMNQIAPITFWVGIFLSPS